MRTRNPTWMGEQMISETMPHPLKVLNPTADRFGGAEEALAPRPASLSGRTVGLLWNGKANGDLALRAVAEQLKSYAPGVRTVFYVGAIRCSSDLLKQVADECDVVVGCTADCGSCTSWMAHDCIQLEQMGTPAVAIVSDGFEINFAASARAFALPGLEFVRVPEVYNNATPDRVLEQTLDVLPALFQTLTGLAGGVAEQVETTRPAVPVGPVIEVAAIEPLEAVGLFNDRFADLGWTDGYPVWPPTADRVAELTDAVGGEVDEVLFRLPPGNGELTLQKLAINCAMANCSPAEMAIVEAVLRAFTDERQRTMVRACLMSTSAHAPIVVINGPLALTLGVNAGRSCVGPGVQNIVNLRIARAISLCLNNLGRWSAGVMDLDTIGTPRKHIVVIAENVEESPWPAFHEDCGFDASDDVVTVFFSMGEWDVGLQGHLDPAQLATALGAFSGGNSGSGYFTNLFADSDKSPMGRLMLMAPVHARALSAGGLSKQALRDILFDTGREPISRLVEPMRGLHRDGKILPQWEWVFDADQETQERTLLPVIEHADDYHIVVAGSGRGKDLLMPTRCKPISRKVRADWLP